MVAIARFSERILMKQLTCLLVALLALSCSEKQESVEHRRLPLGGIEALDALLRDAFREADPHGAVLVVLWTTEAPPSQALQELARPWTRHGLIPLGICLDLLGAEDREEAIQQVRRWERGNRCAFDGLIFDGERGFLAEMLGVDRLDGELLLLSEYGQLLWVGPASQSLHQLERAIQDHLGMPSMAETIRSARRGSGPVLISTGRS
jgi:hypothetical protein